MLGLALVNFLLGGDLDVEHAQGRVDRVERGDGVVRPVDAGFHRGTGWYSTDAVPEPPFALAFVILAAAGMRVYERRLRRRAG